MMPHFLRAVYAAARRARRVLLGACLAGTGALAVAQDASPAGDEALPHEFYFTRGVYSSIADTDPWGPRWAIDFPDADRHFLVALRRLSAVDAYPSDHARGVDEAATRDYPFLYLVEAGALALPPEGARALAGYLEAGGFLMIDDFWGTWAWDNLVEQMKQVFPDRPIVEVPMDHPIFHAFYDIPQLLQVPNVALANTDHTYEYDGKVPHARGIFDDQGRLMVLMNWNTDLGDAWEWADSPDYPLRFSNFAYQMGINIVIYGMSF
jgi:hypothetical protein